MLYLSFLLAVTCWLRLVVGDFGSQSNFNIDEWTHNDLVDYVGDQVENLKEMGSNTYEDLKEQLSSSSNLMSHIENYSERKKPWYNFWSRTPKKSVPQNISDWIFDTWSTTSLHRLLDENNIEFDPSLPKNKLVDVAKTNFDKLAKQLKISGYYPSSNFFQSWTTEDLTHWLKMYGIEVTEDAKDKKDKLLHLVKKNMYHASRLATEKKYDAIRQLNEAGEDVFDKSGKVKESVVEHLPNIDLKSWLESHDIEIDPQSVSDHKYLTDLASKHLDLLKDDFNWYNDHLQLKAMPYVSKPKNFVSSLFDQLTGTVENYLPSSSWISKTGNDIENYDLPDLANWSRSTLKNFLDVRGVKYHTLTTSRELRHLVQENFKKPLKDMQSNLPKLFQKIPVESFKDWLKDTTDVIQDKTAKATDAVSNNMDGFAKESYALKDQLIKKWYQALDTWSTEDLTSYLKNFGINPDATYTKEQLVAMVKEKSQMFLGYPEPKPFYKRWMDTLLLRN